MGSGEHLALVERFTRVAADRIDYEMTLADPTTLDETLDGRDSFETTSRDPL